MKREEIFEYVKNQYGTVPEYLWETSPKSAVLRHKNGKWYAVLMQVEKSRLGLEEESMADVKDSKEKILAISHCNCPERAENVRDMLKKAAEFKDIIILETAGISSMYAADGGIIVVV